MMFGSHHDAPVALPDSMRVLSATVTRASRTGRVLGPEHRVPVETALKALTIWPAWQHFEEDTKGSIEVGKLADFVILSDNPLTVPQDQLDDIKVLETIKEGTSIYTRPVDGTVLSSPAKFGLTLNDGHGPEHAMSGVTPYHGDGCFNHGLSVLMQALESARASKSSAPNL
jgi:cytosine/adenosine deaminase-related metal-dependent hydrolase